MKCSKRLLSLWLALLLLISSMLPYAAIAAEWIDYEVSFVDETGKPLGAIHRIRKGSTVDAANVPALPQGIDGYEAYVDNGDGKHSTYAWDADPTATVIDRNTVFTRVVTTARHRFDYGNPHFVFAKDNARGIVAQYTCQDCGFVGELGVQFTDLTSEGLSYTVDATVIGGTTTYDGVVTVGDIKTVISLAEKVGILPAGVGTTINKVLDVADKVGDIVDKIVEATSDCAKYGHIYGNNPQYQWAKDNTCSAVFTCARDKCQSNYKDHTVTKKMNVTGPVYTYAGCGKAGMEIYTAHVKFALENGAEAQDFSDVKEQEWQAALVHTPVGSAVSNGDATCTEDGTTSWECKYCGMIFKNADEGSALGHAPSAEIREDIVPATCTQDGSYVAVRVCTRCGIEMERENKTLAAHDHTPQKNTVTENIQPATCQAAGSFDRVKYCIICKAEVSRETETIEKTNHTPGVPKIEGTISSCEAGVANQQVESVVYCQDCGEEISRKTVVLPAAQHDYDEGTVINPTCTEEGYTQYTCKVCGDSYTDKIKDALGHDPQTFETKAATCQENGYTRSLCSRCGDEQTEKFPPIVNGNGEPVHSWEATPSETVAATCEADGKYIYRCLTCGESRSEPIPKHAQNPQNPHQSVAVQTKQPTCTEWGYTVYACCRENCAYSYMDNQLAPKGHISAGVIRENEQPASCTQEGCYEEVEYCAECREEIRRTPKTIPIKAHNCNRNTIPSTCITQGYTVYTCKDCGEEFAKDFMPLTGHTPATDAAVPATCQATGKTQGAHCAVCQEVLQAQQSTPLAAHIWNAGEITLQPTLTAAGVKTYCCTVCGLVRTETLSPLPLQEVTPNEEQANQARVNKNIKKPANITTVSKTKDSALWISFSAVQGAQNYRVMYRKAGAKKWNYAWTDGKTDYTLKKLKSGALYEFKFAAYSKNNQGQWERGDYSQTAYRYYYKAKIKTAKARGKRAVKVTWKQDKQAGGYEILYATNKDLKNRKIVDVRNKKQTSATLKKLKKGKTYYVIVRSYKKKGNKKYIGEYSKMKTVKVK